MAWLLNRHSIEIKKLYISLTVGIKPFLRKIVCKLESLNDSLLQEYSLFGIFLDYYSVCSEIYISLLTIELVRVQI